MRKLKNRASDASELVRRLAEDKTFRKRLISAIEHAAEARRRATAHVAGTARDGAVHAELRRARADLEEAYKRVQKKRRPSRLRYLLAGLALGALALVPEVRRRLTELVSREPKLEELTRDELYALAQKADIPGRSEMTKQQLVDALRAADLTL